MEMPLTLGQTNNPRQGPSPRTSPSRATTVPVGVGCHYLGIQFLPGQSRHFIRTSARELTDHSVCAQDALGFSLDGVAERIGARAKG